MCFCFAFYLLKIKTLKYGTSDSQHKSFSENCGESLRTRCDSTRMNSSRMRARIQILVEIVQCLPTAGRMQNKKRISIKYACERVE